MNNYNTCLLSQLDAFIYSLLNHINASFGFFKMLFSIAQSTGLSLCDLHCLYQTSFLCATSLPCFFLDICHSAISAELGWSNYISISKSLVVKPQKVLSWRVYFKWVYFAECVNCVHICTNPMGSILFKGQKNMSYAML